jgi:predicted RecB family nuclease
VRSKKALATLDAAGVRTFGELEALPRSTASYAGSGMGTLPGQIDLARAALAPAPVYARRGVDALSVPRADIEVDVDMESIEQGVYLWGVLLLDRTKQGATPEYRAFATWERLESDVELENSLQFWAWLSGIRADAAREGLSFRAYCYNAAAENTYLRRLGLAGGIMDEVTAFIASTEWVDLLKVVDSQLLTGAGLGLKKVAPLAGFSWSVDGAGGDASMLRYDVAVGGADAQGRENARDWLLTYNRGDVEATLAIRDWLERDGALLPRIESLDSMFAGEGSRPTVGDPTQ